MPDDRFRPMDGERIVVSNTSVVLLESARDSDAIGRSSAVLSGESSLVVFAESGSLFGLRGTHFAADPCPRCVLFHLASAADQVAALRGEVEEDDGVEEPPSVSRETLRELVRRSERTTPEPSLVAYDRADDRWYRTAPLHRHPCCSHRGLPSRGTPTVQQVTDLDDLEATFLDPTFGIVRQVQGLHSAVPAALEPLYADFYTAFSLVVNPLFYRFPDEFDRVVKAAGAGETPGMARLRALMEGLERVGTLLPRPVELVAAEADLDVPCVPLSSFHVYDDSQYARPDFAHPPYDETRPCEWVETSELQSGESVYLPTDLVYIAPPEETEDRLVLGSSNGCAAHLDPDAALVGGITELFERDALMHHWYARSSRPRVRPSTLPEPQRGRVRALESLGYDVHVLDLTRYPPLYCFAVYLVDPDAEDRPRVVPGVGCALGTEAAVGSAIAEALDLLLAATTKGLSALESRADVETTEDHMRYYQWPGRHRHLAPLLESGETVAFEHRSSPDSLAAVTDALREHDVTVYHRELSPASLRRYGVHVVRTVSPDLVPITFGHGNERLAHPVAPVPDNRPEDVPHPIP